MWLLCAGYIAMHATLASRDVVSSLLNHRFGASKSCVALYSRYVNLVL